MQSETVLFTFGVRSGRKSENKKRKKKKKKLSLLGLSFIKISRRTASPLRSYPQGEVEAKITIDQTLLDMVDYKASVIQFADFLYYDIQHSNLRRIEKEGIIYPSFIKQKPSGPDPHHSSHSTFIVVGTGQYPL